MIDQFSIKILIAFIFALFFLLFLNIRLINAESKTITIKNGSYFINYEFTPLSKIIKEIEAVFQISITQLNGIRSENISLSINADSLEDLLIKLMKAIEKNSYAFIYHAEKLTSVYFISGSGYDLIFPEEKTMSDISPKKLLSVRITSVYDETGDLAELQTGDIIIEYDDNIVTEGPIELLKMMKERSENDSIEMRILRDSVPMSIFVPGGIINAGLKTLQLNN